MILRKAHFRLAPAIAALFLSVAPVAAQECGTDFNAWKAEVRAQAEKEGVGAKGLAALDGAQYDTRALARDRSQTVFTQTFDQFSGKIISEQRLSKCQANLLKYADLF